MAILNNFCVLPFNSISIDAEGKIRQCCNAGGLGYPVNVNTHTIDEILNNEYNQSLRQNFLDDVKDQRCDRCWKMEAVGNESFRHWANKQSFGVDGVIPINKDINTRYEDIQYLDITLGNKCNLGCRMCNPGSSHLVARALIKVGEWLGPEMIDFDRAARDKILDLIDRSKNINTIFMLGGEPLINDFHDEIVDLLIKQDRAKNIKLHYSTNLQIDLEKYFDLWSNFDVIETSISIDGTNEIYEYIRWPGSYQKVYNNLVRAKEYAKQFDKFKPSIATTMQNLNVANIYNLLEDIGNGLDLGFFIIPVHGLNHIEICPTHILEKELIKLDNITAPAQWYAGTAKQYLKDAIEKSKNLNSYEVEKFFQRQKEYDEQRKQNLFETIPYFEELADKFKVKIW